MSVKTIEQEKKDFCSYALYIQDDRGYKKSWLYVIFREYFGETPSKDLIDNSSPKRPNQFFMEWLNSTQKRNTNDAAKIADERNKQELKEVERESKSKVNSKKKPDYTKLRIDRAIYNEVKAIAKVQGIGVQEAFRQAMYDYIQKHR